MRASRHRLLRRWITTDGVCRAQSASRWFSVSLSSASSIPLLPWALTINAVSAGRDWDGRRQTRESSIYPRDAPQCSAPSKESGIFYFFYPLSFSFFSTFARLSRQVKRKLNSELLGMCERNQLGFLKSFFFFFSASLAWNKKRECRRAALMLQRISPLQQDYSGASAVGNGVDVNMTAKTRTTRKKIE